MSSADWPSSREIESLRMKVLELNRMSQSGQLEELQKVAKARSSTGAIRSFKALLDSTGNGGASAILSSYRELAEQQQRGDSPTLRVIQELQRPSSTDSALRAAFLKLAPSESAVATPEVLDWANLKHIGEAIDTVGEAAINDFGEDLEAQSAEAKRFVDGAVADVAKGGMSQEVARRLVYGALFAVSTAL